MLDEAAEAAETQATALVKLLRLPADQPLVKGRITLFLFPTRYEYSEFGRMVEERDLPSSGAAIGNTTSSMLTACSWRRKAAATIRWRASIAQQMASVYAASLARTCRRGFAKAWAGVFASRADGRAARVHRWNARLDELFAGGKIRGFLEHKLPPEDGDMAAYGFVKDLMASSTKFSSLIVALRGGGVRAGVHADLWPTAKSGGDLGALGEAALRQMTNDQVIENLSDRLAASLRHWSFRVGSDFGKHFVLTAGTEAFEVERHVVEAQLL